MTPGATVQSRTGRRARRLGTGRGGLSSLVVCAPPRAETVRIACASGAIGSVNRHFRVLSDGARSWRVRISPNIRVTPAAVGTNQGGERDTHDNWSIFSPPVTWVDGPYASRLNATQTVGFLRCGIDTLSGRTQQPRRRVYASTQNPGTLNSRPGLSAAIVWMSSSDTPVLATMTSHSRNASTGGGST